MYYMYSCILGLEETCCMLWHLQTRLLLAAAASAETLATSSCRLNSPITWTSDHVILCLGGKLPANYRSESRSCRQVEMNLEPVRASLDLERCLSKLSDVTLRVKMANFRGITVLAVCSVLYTAEASSILGFAIVGGTSHQASLANMGLELMKRGHNFTLLLSSEDAVSQARLSRQPFSAVRQMNFSGPPHIGSHDWLMSIPRDPQKVRRCL